MPDASAPSSSGTAPGTTDEDRSDGHASRPPLSADEVLSVVRDAVFVTSLDGRILSWNRGAERMYGVPAEEALGAVADDLFQTERPVGAGLQREQDYLVAHGHWAGRARQRLRDGRVIVTDATAALLRDDDGVPYAVAMVNRDVTETAVAEERLRWLGDLTDRLAAGSGSVAGRHLVEPFAQAVCERVGGSVAVFVVEEYRRSLDLATVVDRDPAAQARWWQYLGDGRPFTNEGTLGTVVRDAAGHVALDATSRDLAGFFGRPWPDPVATHGVIAEPMRFGTQIVGALVVMGHVDGPPLADAGVDEIRRQAATAGHLVGLAGMLARSRRQEHLLGSLDDAVFTLDTDGVVRGWNSGAEALYGLSRADALGREWNDLLGHRFIVSPSAEEFFSTLRRGQVWHGRSVLTSDRGPRTLDVRSLPVLDADGELVAVTSVVRDVTDEASLRIEREQRQELLDALARAMDAPEEPGAWFGGVLDSLLAGGEDLAMLWLADPERGGCALTDVRDRDRTWRERWERVSADGVGAAGQSAIVAAVLQSGETIVQRPEYPGAQPVDGMSGVDPAAATDLDRAMLRRAASLLALPIRFAGEVIGVLVTGRDASSVPYDATAVSFAEGVAETVDGFIGAATLLARLRLQSHVLEQISDAVVAVDADRTVTYWSRAAADLAGVPAADAIGRPFSDIVGNHWELAESPGDVWSWVTGAGGWEGRVALADDAGQRLDLDVRIRALHDPSGAVAGAVVVAHDVTALMVANRMRQREADFAAAVLASLPDATFVVDAQGRLISANRLFIGVVEPVVGRPLVAGDDLLAVSDTVLAGAHPWPEVRAGMLEVLAGERELLEAELRLPDEPPRWLAVQATPLPFESGGAVVSAWDITDQKVTEASLALAASSDPLTGLPNRDTLLVRLGEALVAAARRGRPLGVAFIDLDHFKSVNDTHGHAVGDEVLVHAADVLRAAVRADDTVARISGDEFVVLVDVPDRETLDRLARRLVGALGEPVVTSAGSVTVGASIGLRCVDPDERRSATPQSLVTEADTAMYAAKAAGRGRYAWAPATGEPVAPADG